MKEVDRLCSGKSVGTTKKMMSAKFMNILGKATDGGEEGPLIYTHIYICGREKKRVGEERRGLR